MVPTIKKFIIPQTTIQALFDYLKVQPWAEVQPLIQLIYDLPEFKDETESMKSKSKAKPKDLEEPAS